MVNFNNIQKKVIGLLLIVTLVITNTSTSIAYATGDSNGFAGGNGTAENPYIIQTAKQLDEIRYGLDKHYKLDNDIDLTVFLENTPKGWVPIGTEDDPFTGTLDGNNHQVTGLWINAGFELGFFGWIKGGTIKNLGVVTDEEKNIIGVNTIGILASIAENVQIDNCYTI
ncbi:hypothetical protein AOC36_08605 [Erysipelothrix larvae]|uniref:Uncharacterized protein n=1 Tax=Erysipelothrix larvae TaxID=1514105 RepID=A0A0X8H0W9_9FIRM|nr:hypothetical protein [Erysipelothrix larvae]AMC94045.1 hypothetical protein AOC36_08605 [Erysipelothrix larvae]